MYKVFVKDIPIILSTKKNIGSQYTAIPLKIVNFKNLIKQIIKGDLYYINLYHKNEEKLEKFLKKKLPVVQAAGGLVYNDKREILFIYRNSKWDLPKGKAEKNEQLPQTALREVKEETGINEVSINKPLDITYHIFRRNNEYRLKVTYWFDMFSDYEGIFFPQLDEGITDVKWVKKADLEEVKINSYPNIRLLF